MSTTTGTNPLFSGWSMASASSLPPTFGALPDNTPPAHAQIFYCLPVAGTSVLNCRVHSPQNPQVQFDVRSSEAITTILRRNGEVCASIEWQRHPMVEWSGRIPRQRASQWVGLTADSRRRNVSIGGVLYAWIPRGADICLHSHDAVSGELARIVHASAVSSSVMLQISQTAINSGFLEPCVMATILFMSGKNID